MRRGFIALAGFVAFLGIGQPAIRYPFVVNRNEETVASETRSRATPILKRIKICDLPEHDQIATSIQKHRLIKRPSGA
jgi:hypothetical protein